MSSLPGSCSVKEASLFARKRGVHAASGGLFYNGEEQFVLAVSKEVDVDGKQPKRDQLEILRSLWEENHRLGQLVLVLLIGENRSSLNDPLKPSFKLISRSTKKILKACNYLKDGLTCNMIKFLCRLHKIPVHANRSASEMSEGRR